MATSLIGPCLVLRASAAAPVPRPPQPTKATWIVLFSAACTAGITTPDRAEAVATVPVVLRKSRRDALGIESVMMSAPWGDRAQSAGGNTSRLRYSSSRSSRQDSSGMHTTRVAIEQPTSGTAHPHARRWSETLTLFI